MQNKLTIFAVPSALFALFLAVTSVRADDALDAAWKGLTGIWTVESAKAQVAGEVEEVPMKGAVFTLGKDKCVVTIGEEKVEGACKLDVSVTPATIDIVPSKKKVGEEDTMLGIYKVDGDTLTISWAGNDVSEGPGGQRHVTLGKRPTTFATGENALLMTLKRKAP